MKPLGCSTKSTQNKNLSINMVFVVSVPVFSHLSSSPFSWSVNESFPLLLNKKKCTCVPFFISNLTRKVTETF